MSQQEESDYSRGRPGAGSPGNSPGAAMPNAADSTGSTDAGARWLKIDFHLHSSEDPCDELDHSAVDLLHRAHALGFGALAITLHSHVLMNRDAFDTAKELGLLLIPAAEMRLEGADVVVVNITPEEARGLRRLSDLAELRQRRGRSVFIFPPHPFYVLGGSIGRRRLREHIDLFDAIELCHFHTRWFNPNWEARKAAKAFRKPLLATSDTHHLDFFGEHYTLVPMPRSSGAIPCAESIFDAIRDGMSRTVSPPWPLRRFLRYSWWLFAVHELRVLKAKLAGR